MSYAIAGPLQAAVFDRLGADAALNALVAGAIFDAVPPGVAPSLYVVLGPEKVQDRSDQTGRAAEHEFTVSVITDVAGFASAKAAAGAVSDALDGADLTLTRGALVFCHFLRAQAARVGAGGERQVDLIFRARVEDD